MNIPSACRIANIAANNAMILAYDANSSLDGIFGKDSRTIHTSSARSPPRSRRRGAARLNAMLS